MWECAEICRSQLDSNSDGYFKRRKKKLICKSVFLCLSFIYLEYGCNLCICVSVFSVTYMEQLSQESNSDLVYDPG